jgi:hypothetical protein
MAINTTPINPGVPRQKGTSLQLPKAATAPKGGFWSSFKSWFWGKDGLTFGDLFDVVNPLQQLPVVSTLYRAMSGDTIAAGPRLLGGALFGGPLGLATAAANTAIEQTTGKDVGDHVLALLHWPAPSTEAPIEVPVALASVKNPSVPVLAPPAHQLPLIKARNTYAHNSRLLARPHFGQRFSTQF